MSDLLARLDGDLKDPFSLLQDLPEVLGKGAEDVGTIECGGDFIWGGLTSEVAFDPDLKHNLVVRLAQLLFGLPPRPWRY